MFKKSLLAVAVLATVSAPAFADVVFQPKNQFEATKLAFVTKQPVLSFSTANQLVEVTFDQRGDLKPNGFITLEVTGDATFNGTEVRNWLKEAAAGAEYTGIAVAATGEADTSGIKEDVERLFRVEGGVIQHSIDQGGKRLRLFLVKDAVETDADGGAIIGGESYKFGTKSKVDFDLNKANNIFNLKSGETAKSVGLKVGALRNATYTADPKAIPNNLFELGSLFSLQDPGALSTPATITLPTKDTAILEKRYTQLKGIAGDQILAPFALVNNTTNQSIATNKVRLNIKGDFSGFQKNKAGALLDKDGNATGWTESNGVATALVSQLNSAGKVDGKDNLGLNFILSVAGDNKTSINGGVYSVEATILGSSQETFNDFTSNLLDIVKVDRDGMTFDTITTGTTAANKIFVRDISGILPKEGGKIYVTIVEYDQHGANGRGEGKELVKRVALKTTLPSNGAVTLAPADVAAEVGAAITPERQARFVFEVETNKGEVAVKKSNSEGVDIQNGTKGTFGIVDFTL